ncbi:hypothetical protein [Vallitalea sp.]|jgi:hypothetical protein|uniref:hypothetical protein n=1 Tax=Vallitalea sp. TaxID=1882829 RepID=UPI0025D0D435|nr:hypothetical protein [Vallitalea sp.]MCT4687869.1 hypothetical protein [Vallitalea sp.]
MSQYAKHTEALIHISKNTPTGNGNSTTVALKYIHTYQSAKGTISINASPSGIGTGFTLQDVSKQWNIVAYITNINY